MLGYWHAILERILSALLEVLGSWPFPLQLQEKFDLLFLPVQAAKPSAADTAKSVPVSRSPPSGASAEAGPFLPAAELEPPVESGSTPSASTVKPAGLASQSVQKSVSSPPAAPLSEASREGASEASMVPAGLASGLPGARPRSGKAGLSESEAQQAAVNSAGASPESDSDAAASAASAAPGQAPALSKSNIAEQSATQLTGAPDPSTSQNAEQPAQQLTTAHDPEVQQPATRQADSSANGLSLTSGTTEDLSTVPSEPIGSDVEDDDDDEYDADTDDYADDDDEDDDDDESDDSEDDLYFNDGANGPLTALMHRSFSHCGGFALPVSFQLDQYCKTAVSLDAHVAQYSVHGLSPDSAGSSQQLPGHSSNSQQTGSSSVGKPLEGQFPQPAELIRHGVSKPAKDGSEHNATTEQSLHQSTPISAGQVHSTAASGQQHLLARPVQEWFMGQTRTAHLKAFKDCLLPNLIEAQLTSNELGKRQMAFLTAAIDEPSGSRMGMELARTLSLLEHGTSSKGVSCD